MKWFALPALLAFCFASAAPQAGAQVNINVQVGPAPVCPYGYFDYAPYGCAPLGYYGPQWFMGGVFIGAGPWFHGPVGFLGYIDRDYDPRFGYRGRFPERGEHSDWGRHLGWEKQFRGREMRSEYRHDNGNHYGQYKEHGNNGKGHGHDDDDNGHGKGHGHDK
jgi:hypothetical protein